MSDSDTECSTAGTPEGIAHAGASIVRSEERLTVATETVPVGRVRLRKYLVTEEQTVTVPVTREEIALDYEDLPEHERVGDGSPLSEDRLEVVRYEERVVVTLQRVAVERIRLARRVVTVDRAVTGQVRREVVDLEDGTTPGATGAGTP